MAADPKRPAHYGGSDEIVDPRAYGKMHELNFDEVSAIKYITRWRKPGGGGVKSIHKAIHYLELLAAEADKEAPAPAPDLHIPQPDLRSLQEEYDAKVKEHRRQAQEGNRFDVI